MNINQPIKHLLRSGWLLLLTGCLGGTTPPAQFYLLEPVNLPTNSPMVAVNKSLIALGPIRIPHYLDRPQMVTASAKNVYQVNELHRWAEPLDGNISRVLQQNLAVLIPAEVVLNNASNLAKQARYRLSVNILEFHVTPQSQASLTAHWQITEGETLHTSRQVAYQLPASTTDYRVMVEALNECLNRMSKDIADELSALGKSSAVR